jgi:hypothetical protein
MLLAPAFRFTVTAGVSVQVVQEPVAGKLRVETLAPFTISEALRSPEALAKRQTRL